MNLTKTGLCMLLMACMTKTAIGAPRFWVSAISSNWNNTLNWSASSGGLPGASVPVAADAVTFDNMGLGNCTIDAAVSVTSINVSGYTGIISQGANSIAVSTTAGFGTGTFAGGTANMTITGAFTLSGTAFTSTAAILELQDNAAFTAGSFTHNSGTVRFNCTHIAAETISGTSPAFYTLEFVGISRGYTISSTGNISVANNLIISGTSFYNLFTGGIDVKGDINISNTATGCGGDATININGTGTQNFNGNSIAGAGALPQLTINKTSGTLNLANFPGVSNNFTYTAGTVNAGVSTFCFTHGTAGTYNITGSLSLTNIDFAVNTSLLAATISAATTITATGDLTIAGTGGLRIQTGNINVNGNVFLTNTATNGGGSATINIVGSGAETIDGTAIIVNQSRLPLVNINNSGTLTLAGNISFSANLTYTSGILNAGTSTCYIVGNITTLTGNFSLNNLTLAGLGGGLTVTVASLSTVTVANTLDLENSANNITLNTGTIAVQGNIVDNNTSTIGGGTGTILISGSGAQTITTTGIIDQGRFPAVTINKPSGTVVLPALMTVRLDWTWLAGTIDALTNNSTVVFENSMNITGTQTLNNVTFNGAGNNVYTLGVGTTLTVPGTMTMMGVNNVDINSGNITLTGNMVLTNTSIGDGGSTVITFSGAANQTITSALPVNQSSLPSVTINKTGGALTFPALVTVRGSWTYTAGAYDVTTNNSTIVLAGPLSGANTITGTHTLNNVILEGNVNNAMTFATGTILTVTGTLTTLGASNVFINTPVTGTTAIQAQGNIAISNTSVAGGGTGLILINGTGAQSFTSIATAGLGQLPYITIQKTAGTLTMTGIFSVTRDWNYISGVVDATTNLTTVDFGWSNLLITSAGMNFYNLLFNSNNSTLATSLTALGSLTINGTGVLAPGANTINLAGSWTDRSPAGFTEATSTVNFNGSSLQTVTTPGGENFTNIIVNNAGAGIQLGSAVAVATGLTMTAGNIDLNGNTLTLGTTALLPGTLTYTAGTMINTGSFTRWFAKSTVAVGAPAGLFPTGTAANYRPFAIAVTTAPTTGGTVMVTYTDATSNTVVSFADGGSTVQVRKDLNWAVSTSLLAGGLYSPGISGTGFGLVGAVTDLRLTLAGGVIGAAGVNAGTVLNPQVNRTGLLPANLVNSFYLGSINAINSPLPVTLTFFRAAVGNGDVILSWATAQEFNSDFFTIQRSKDAASWTDLERIAAAGNSSKETSYSASDGEPYDGVSYYRLMQTDLDGKQTWSGVRAVKRLTQSAITFFPNPAAGSIRINFPQTDTYQLGLFNSSGQLAMSPVNFTGNSLSWPLTGLVNGVYFLQIGHRAVVEWKEVVVKK